MRISDWSSDVCSSDLTSVSGCFPPTRGACPGAAAIRYSRTVDAALAQAGSVVVSTRPAPARRNPRRETGKLESAITVWPFRDLDRWWNPSALGAVGFRVPWRLVPAQATSPPGRSEENTSELPSLI